MKYIIQQKLGTHIKTFYSRRFMEENNNNENSNILYSLNLGMGIGLTFGIIFNQIPIGLCVGAVIGLGLGNIGNLIKKQLG
jgi:hypothetical protein